MIVELIALFFIALIASFFASFSGGAGLITVPATMFFGLPPAEAIATNRVGWIASMGALLNVKGKLNIGKKIPLLLIIAHVSGAIIGTLILISIPNQDLLFRIIGLLLIAGSFFTYFSPKGTVTKTRKDLSSRAIFACGSLLFGLGIFRGFFGPASGIINRLIIVETLGIDYIQTIALSTYLWAISSLVTAIIVIAAGLFNFVYAIPLALGMLIGFYFGTKYAINKGNEFIKKFFVAIELLSGIYFLLFGIGAIGG